MTRNEELTRRALLGSLGTVGTAGAAVGAGTTGLFTDREQLRESVASGGRLDLLVSWPGGTSEDGVATLDIDLSDGGSGSERFTVELPDSNPGRVWLRTICPSGPAESVSGSLSYVCNDEVLAAGSLVDIADALRNGVHLDPDCATDDGCLGPDTDLELEFSWSFSPTDDYDGTDPEPVGIQFQYHAVQCRHAAATNPFPESDPCDTDAEPEHAISFIAFCSAEPGPINPVVTATSPTSSEATTAQWETDVPVGYVIAKWSTKMTIYDFTGDPKTSGTARVADSDAAIQEYETSPGGGGPSDAARPCEVASSLLGGFDVESTAKLEESGGVWIEE
jgi:hypothetical protein